MDKSFHIENRKKLYESFSDNSLMVIFAGNAPRLSADAYYPFFTNRNFVYLTGLSGAETAGFIFIAEKNGGEIKETVFILPPDEHAEIWNGRRFKPDEVQEMSGIENINYIEDFNEMFHKIVTRGLYEEIWIDLDKLNYEDPFGAGHKFSQYISGTYPFLKIKNLYFPVRKLRTIKKPCEIEAMKEAMKVTKKGIEAMMRGVKAGMYEYQLKAIFDHALADEGVLVSAFPSIVSSGNNNFCIHYYGYKGIINDGDMILNDVGACYDNLCNDVSRGFPVNGKFSERQKLLYTCAYNTSEYMFSIIKPGMPMKDVDLTARRYNYEQLKEIGLCESYDQIGKYMWHGGAHHVGYDVHDVVDMEMTVSEGMVFCVDIGIYCREWGIGFRLEDNCLVTEDGCINLSADIPRSIEDIEAFMKK